TSGRYGAGRGGPVSLCRASARGIRVVVVRLVGHAEGVGERRAHLAGPLVGGAVAARGAGDAGRAASPPRAAALGRGTGPLRLRAGGAQGLARDVPGAPGRSRGSAVR